VRCEKQITYTFNDINSKRDFIKNMLYADVKANVKPFDINKSELVAQVGITWCF